MKNFFTLILFMTLAWAPAQEIVLKGGVFFVNGKPCLRSDMLGVNSWELLTMDGKTSIIGKTFTEYEDCAPVFRTKLVITGPGNAETLIAKGTYSKRTVATLMIRTGFLDPNTCRINWNRLDTFVKVFSDE
ncbi:MAG: hypothetical protein GXO27_03715 [Chlorobi bacterium]|nr:hypothetical protein [Chlorobiota bacterium]